MNKLDHKVHVHTSYIVYFAYRCKKLTSDVRNLEHLHHIDIKKCMRLKLFSRLIPAVKVHLKDKRIEEIQANVQTCMNCSYACGIMTQPLTLQCTILKSYSQRKTLKNLRKT